MSQTTAVLADNNSIATAVQPLSLRRNFSWAFVGNAVFVASNAVIIFLLMNLTDTATVGRFTMGYTIATTLFMLTDLSLRIVQVTDHNRSFAFSDYLGMRLLTCCLGLSAVAIFVLARPDYGWEKSWIIILIGMTKAMDSVADINYGLLQQRERMDRLAVSMIFKGLVSVMLVGMLLWATGNILVAIGAMLLTRIFVLAVYDFPSAAWSLGGTSNSHSSALTRWSSAIRPRWNGKTLRSIFLIAWPLGATTTLMALNTTIPRFVVDWIWGGEKGDQMMGILGPFTYLLVLGQLIVGALGHAASLRLSQYYADHRYRDFYRLLLKLVTVGFVIGGGSLILSFLIGEPLLALLANEEYVEHIELLNWLLLAGAVSYVASFLGYGVTATRAFGRLTIPYGIVTVLAFVVAVLLIPRFELLGAAWTILFVSVGNCIMPIYILRQLSLKRAVHDKTS